MANLNEADQWETGIYQLEEDDPVLGGPSGIDNRPPRELANRTAYLRRRGVSPWDATLSYPANVAYVSYSGTTWKSVGDSTNVTPGSDPAKWVRWAFTAAELAASLGDAVAAHEAKSDPHPQYATDADLAAHLAAPNPHAQYAKSADLAAHIAAPNPHAQYAKTTDLADHVAAANPHVQYVRHDAAQGLTVGQKQQARDNIEAEESGAAARLALGSRIKGLTGNTGVSGTTATFTAAEILMRNPSTGGSLLALNAGPLVCNINTAGPAANGRDQAAAFGNNSWVHFWFISDGAGTIATLASISATAPTLPAGFVASAYIGAVRLGAGTLASVRFLGAKTLWDSSQIALTNGQATTMTAVNVAAFVPPNALAFDIMIRDFVCTPAAGNGLYDVTQTLSATSTGTMFRLGFSGVQSSAFNASTGGQMYQMPNLGQQYYYLVATGASNPVSSTHHISAYINPNGGA